LQAKLRIDQPGDIYEQEADRMAERVMHMPEPQVQRQAEEEEEEPLQTKRDMNTTPEVATNLTSQIQAIQYGGQPLSKSERAYFEPRFGSDFSRVRVHTDMQAAESTRAVNAKAYTLGQDVVFGTGQDTSGTSEGRRLMAHELTHVVQQNKNGLPHIQTKSSHNYPHSGLSDPSNQNQTEIHHYTTPP